MIRIMMTFGLGAIFLVSCGNGGPNEVTETRTVQSPPKAAEPPAEKALPPGHPSISPFKWETPPGWTETAPTSMRIANFKLASSPDTECYMTVLQGSAGGLVANVNRWRAQMGQEEISAEAVAQLPKIDVLGQPSPVAEIAGSFAGMSGMSAAPSAPKPGYMLLGMVTELSGQTLFVKMTGPENVVKAEKDHFLAFCKSLKQTLPPNPHAAMGGMGAPATGAPPASSGPAATGAGAPENK